MCSLIWLLHTILIIKSDVTSVPKARHCKERVELRTAEQCGKDKQNVKLAEPRTVLSSLVCPLSPSFSLL